MAQKQAAISGKEPGKAKGDYKSSKHILWGMDAKIHPGKADQKESGRKQDFQCPLLCFYGKGRKQTGASLGMAAWEGVAGGMGKRARYRWKIRIQNPRTRNPEGDFQPLHNQTGRKVGQADLAGKGFIYTPVQAAENCQ